MFSIFQVALEYDYREPAKPIGLPPDMAIGRKVSLVVGNGGLNSLPQIHSMNCCAVLIL